MAEDKGCTDVKITVAALREVVLVAAAETCGNDLDLDVTCLRGTDGPMKDTDVTWCVENSSGDGRYSERRHGEGGESTCLLI